MKWKQTPIAKIYEALGCVADGRVEVSGDTSKVFSSSGGKFYTVTYDPVSQAIMVNDNGSFWGGYLGYPAVAYLMIVGELSYSPKIAAELKGIAWKDINQKFKNDFDKAVEFILSSKPLEIKEAIEAEVNKIYGQLTAKSYNLLGRKMRPPAGY